MVMEDYYLIGEATDAIRAFLKEQELLSKRTMVDCMYGLTMMMCLTSLNFSTRKLA